MAESPRLPQRLDRNLAAAADDVSAAPYQSGGPAQAAYWRDDNGAGPDREVDWRRWAYLIWKRKWWVLAVTVLGTALSVLIARSQEPIYEVRAMLWIESPERGSGPIEISEMFSPAGWVDLLTSYAVLDAVVHELRLYLSLDRQEDRPLFNSFELTDNNTTGSYRFVVRLDNSYVLLDEEDRELATAQPGDTIGGESLGFRWVPPQEQLNLGKDVSFGVMLPRSVADGLHNELDIKIDVERGNFIHVAYSGHEAHLAANVLNAIVDRFVSLAAELKRQKLTQLAGTLEEQLELASERLWHAESELQAFRISSIALPRDTRGQGTAAGGAGSPLFDRFFAVVVEHEAIQRDRQELSEILRRLQESGELEITRLEIVPSVRTASALLAALQELAQKELGHRTLLYRYTSEHADARRAESEVNTLRLRTIAPLISQLMERLARRELQLTDQLQTDKTELRQIPPREVTEQRLRRDFALAENLHNSLRVRYKEAQVAEAATQPNVRALDRASAPAWPTENAAIRVVILGFLISLGVGLGGVIAHDRFVDRRVQYPEQVVSDLGLPILGVVPNLKALTAGGSEAELEATQMQSVVEAFRALRTQLTHGLGVQYPAVIAITSPGMGDGKSLVTSNLALAFADPERPTVLIDADLRRGNLHGTFGVSLSPGLTDYLRGDAEAVLVVKPTETAGLFITPRGPYSEEVPELLDGEGLPALLQLLRQRFKLILIDTPPLAAGVDAVLIGAHADAVLAVLRSGQTDLDLARAKIESYAQMLGVPIVGAILNDVKLEGPYRHYSYGYEVHPAEVE